MFRGGGNCDHVCMVTSSKRKQSLWDVYAFPMFRPQPTVRGVFGDPKARVITRERRSKKGPAAAVVERSSAGRTGGRVGFAICPAVLMRSADCAQRLRTRSANPICSDNCDFLPIAVRQGIHARRVNGATRQQPLSSGGLTGETFRALGATMRRLAATSHCSGAMPQDHILLPGRSLSRPSTAVSILCLGAVDDDAVRCVGRYAMVAAARIPRT